MLFKAGGKIKAIVEAAGKRNGVHTAKLRSLKKLLRSFQPQVGKVFKQCFRRKQQIFRLP